MIDQDAAIADNGRRIAELKAEQAAIRAVIERLEILTNNDEASCRKKDNVTFVNFKKKTNR